MDQTAPADQGVLRHLGECREEPDLDRRVHVCAHAIVRKRLKLEASMHEILQILSLTLFEKTPPDQLLTLSMETPNQLGGANQLILFE